ncbi:DUF2807 domain-containing protein [Pedobacter sp.]|uniref:GIN domain-containing protein n=1 Tax=Pedobacter sp. TaxID=1411316 RepID=UPI0031D883CE
MKTSNKLLIAFAAALIIIPILGMVYVSKAIYVDEEKWSEIKKRTDSFDAISENMEAIPLNKFNSINIPDGKETSFSIHLIKDQKSGVKIEKGDKNLVQLSVDEQEQLQIGLIGQKDGRRYVNIYIYTPDVNAISVVNGGTLDLVSKTDSLAISLKKTKYLSFGSTSAFQKLSITADEGSHININNDIAKSLNLKLNNTSFTSSWASYQELNITTAGKSEISIQGDIEQRKKEFQIQNLTLRTTDSATVNFDAIKIQKATGSLSDQTTIQMPIINLKQILK